MLVWCPPSTLSSSSNYKLQLTALQKANFLCNSDESLEITPYDVPVLLTQRQFSNKAEKVVNNTLITLFSKQDKDKTATSKKQVITTQIALDLLVSTLEVNEGLERSSLSQDTVNVTLNSYLYGNTSGATEASLAQEIIITQAIQNNLLNDYLTLKRKKNALTAITNF